MKKIILGLFLILGAISFSAPSRVNTAKIKQDGLMTVIDKDNAYSFAEPIGNSLLVITYYVGEFESGSLKQVSETLKNQQLVEGIEYINSGESENGYIHKLHAPGQGYYFYVVIAKKQKVNNYVTTGILTTKEEYSSKNDLKNIINSVVTSGEKYLK